MICKTVDDVEVVPGMTVWVIDGESIKSHVVKATGGPYKILFDEDFGCRSSVAFSTHAAAFEAHRSQYITPELTKDDARAIRAALAKELSLAQAITQILRVAVSRELKEVERFQLPWQLRSLPRTELEEQVDPWISLEMFYASLIEKLEFPCKTKTR